MKKIIIEIECYEDYCHRCLEVKVNKDKRPYCRIFNKELKFARHHFCERLPECINLETRNE